MQPLSAWPPAPTPGLHLHAAEYRPLSVLAVLTLVNPQAGWVVVPASTPLPVATVADLMVRAAQRAGWGVETPPEQIEARVYMVWLTSPFQRDILGVPMRVGVVISQETPETPTRFEVGEGHLRWPRALVAPLRAEMQTYLASH